MRSVEKELMEEFLIGLYSAHDEKYVSYLNENPEFCMDVMKEHGFAVEFVKEQTPEICMAAVQQNGLALGYVKNQTPEICEAAIKENPDAIKHVKVKTEKLCGLAEVERNKMVAEKKLSLFEKIDEVFKGTVEKSGSNDIYLEAARFVDKELSQPDGGRLLWVANIYYMLTETDLSEDEMVKMTMRIDDLDGRTGTPILTAERVDAVRYMLEYGISPKMSPEFTSITPEQTKDFLLSCDMDVLADLVDMTALDSQEHYGPEVGFLCEDTVNRVNKAIESAFPVHDKSSLASKIFGAKKQSVQRYETLQDTGRIER